MAQWADVMLQAKDERIEGLSMELARKAQEQALGLSELDGLRKHSLLQIDQARAEARLWKAKFERVDVENMSTVLQNRQNVIQRSWFVSFNENQRTGNTAQAK